MEYNDISMLIYNSGNIDEEGLNAFITAYIRRGTEIILHDHLYNEFQDKLPNPEFVAKSALVKFIKNFKKIQPEMFWKRLQESFHAQVVIVIHEQIKRLSQDVYDKVSGAEEKLMHYEMNILLSIERLSREFKYSDHIYVASKVINEFLEHVRFNGTKDKKGYEIRNFPYFITTIIKRRIIDQLRRERKMKQFPEKTENDSSSQDLLTFNAENTLADEIHNRELRQIFKREIPKLDNLEKFIIINQYYKGKRTKEIIDDIFIVFQKRITPSTYSKIKKRALAKLKTPFTRTCQFQQVVINC